MSTKLDHLRYYRLPWNYADNGISWLEPTNKCNLRCEGCYRDLESFRHKSLDEVRGELETFRMLRKSDCMSIAGGDPLVYPHIVELVGIIRKMGWKPIVNTNGVALDRHLLSALKKQGSTASPSTSIRASAGPTCGCERNRAQRAPPQVRPHAGRSREHRMLLQRDREREDPARGARPRRLGPAARRGWRRPWSSFSIAPRD